MVRANVHAGHIAELRHSWNVQTMLGRNVRHQPVQDPPDFRRPHLRILCRGDGGQDDCYGSIWEKRIPTRIMEQIGFLYCFRGVRLIL